MVQRIPLYGKLAAGRVVLVDDEDYELVSRYRWHAHVKHCKRGTDRMYARTRLGPSHVYMHKLLTGYPQTDHQDGDGLNNCRYNLRDVTTTQNSANQQKGPGRSRYKGVHWHKPGHYWVAQITISRRGYHLGCFTDEKAAAHAYDEAALKAWGEHARLNRPKGE